MNCRRASRYHHNLDGTFVQSGWTDLTNASFLNGGNGNAVSFQNLQSHYYWSTTAYGALPDRAFFFFKTGVQDFEDKADGAYAWAYRIGDSSASAPVPAPATILLLASGLLGIVGLRKRFSKEQ